MSETVETTKTQQDEGETPSTGLGLPSSTLRNYYDFDTLQDVQSQYSQESINYNWYLRIIENLGIPKSLIPKYLPPLPLFSIDDVYQDLSSDFIDLLEDQIDYETYALQRRDKRITGSLSNPAVDDVSLGTIKDGSWVKFSKAHASPSLSVTLGGFADSVKDFFGKTKPLPPAPNRTVPGGNPKPKNPVNIDYQAPITIKVDDHDIPPRLVTVTRARYEAFSDALFINKEKLITLRGYTGSGKSTYALLPLFYKRTNKVLLVEPTWANVQDACNNFNVNMKKKLTNDSHYVPDLVVRTLDSTTAPPLFSVTTVYDVFNHIKALRSLSYFDYIVLDEYHQPTMEMKTVHYYLRYLDHPFTRVLVSATPDGLDPPKPEVDSIIDYEYSLPQISDKMDVKDTPFDPHLYGPDDCGCILVIVASKVDSEALAKAVNHTGTTRTIVEINEDSDYTDAMDAYGKMTDSSYVIITPRVEAGLTIPAKFMINTKFTQTVAFNNGVVYPTRRLLTESESVQRTGRGGRVTQTMHIYPPEAATTVQNPDDSYMVANALVILRAHGSDLDRFDKLDQFPMVHRLTEIAAQAACSLDGPPIVNSFKVNKTGVKFSQFGGTANNFVDEKFDSLRIYYYPNGFFILPFYDITTPLATPFSFLPQSLQKQTLDEFFTTLKTKMPSMKEPDFNQVVSAIARDPKIFVDAILDGFKAIEGNASNTMGFINEQVAPDALITRVCGPKVGAISEIMEDKGVIRMRMNHAPANANGWIKHNLTIAKVGGDRRSHNFSIASSFLIGDTYDTQLITSTIVKFLSSAFLSATFRLSKDAPSTDFTDKSTLAEYSQTPNLWFKSNVLKA